jgi:hypothetical protein
MKMLSLLLSSSVNILHPLYVMKNNDGINEKGIKLSIFTRYETKSFSVYAICFP